VRYLILIVIVFGLSACAQAPQPPTPTPTPEPVTRTFDDGIVMVQVPAGCFQMGSDDGEENERPAHEQCFESPFWIDRTEVTQGDFDRLGGFKSDPENAPQADHPVFRINWFEARDFCALRGARLPTEAEWEYAARGSQNFLYPWGNDYDESRFASANNQRTSTSAVDLYPQGASWVGALGMIGNVAEWTSSLDMPYPYVADDGREDLTVEADRVQRGGDQGYYTPNYFSTTRRDARTPFSILDGGGFRCAHEL